MYIIHIICYNMHYTYIGCPCSKIGYIAVRGKTLPFPHGVVFYDFYSVSHVSLLWRSSFKIFLHIFSNCNLLLQQIHATDREYDVASSLLGVGVDYAQISNAAYTRVLFLLSRVMVSSFFNENLKRNT